MSELTDYITIKESNLSHATKKDYDFRLGLFYRFAPISSDDELIDCPSEELWENQRICPNCGRDRDKMIQNNPIQDYEI